VSIDGRQKQVENIGGSKLVCIVYTTNRGLTFRFLPGEIHHVWSISNIGSSGQGCLPGSDVRQTSHVDATTNTRVKHARVFFLTRYIIVK
jgi:hypothetical protein